MKEKQDALNGNRDSSIELLRIITMLVIIAHHYVVNSGLLDVISHDCLHFV